jgi:serine/threonine-protein kinase
LASVGLSEETFPIKRFTPIAILGDSPRAVVTLCRDKQRGTKVAVKCFKGIAPALFPTFESEANKNKQLSHTSIAKIVDSGILNGKTPYLVTEYKDGFNVEQCFALYGSPSYDVAVNILIGACEALSYGQKQSLLHRDIRPGNLIFLDDLNSRPSVCITDFALPKIKQREQLSDPWFAIYMSGEEARNLPYTEKSEVYSLGCTGYMILAGRPPFIEGSPLDIKNDHALKLPPRISTIKFDKTRPKDLDEVIEKCLEKDPGDRFESIAKLQERLEVFPRRRQMRIDAVLASRKRAKIIRIAVVGLIAAAICAAGVFAITHH